MNHQLHCRYKAENGIVFIEVAVNNFRQLFNERDPAPFKEKDLSEDFITYVMNSVQEFPLKTKMQLRIHMKSEVANPVDVDIIKVGIHSYFLYESQLVRTKMKKHLRIARLFLLIGIIILLVCLGISQYVSSLEINSKLIFIIEQSFVIIGWVAMWRPIEVFLYDWWPIREQQGYLKKLAAMKIEITQT